MNIEADTLHQAYLTFKAPEGRAKALAAGARALLPGGALLQVSFPLNSRVLRDQI